jgi:hypothetical protein
MSKKTPTPNKQLDELINRLLREADTEIPIDTKVKVVQMAINWEKVKYHIAEGGGEGLDPDIFGPSNDTQGG